MTDHLLPPESDSSGEVRLTVPAETDTPEVRIGRGGALTLAAQVVGLGTSFLVGIIVARVLGAEGKGTLAVIMQVPAILMVVLDLGVATANIYFVSRKEVRAGTAAANSLVIAALFGLVGAPVIYALLVGPLRIAPGIPALATAFAIVVLPTGLFSAWLMGVTAGVGRLGLLPRYAIASSVTTLGIIAVLLARHTGGISGVVGASVAGTIVGVAVLMFGLRRELRPFRTSIDAARAATRFSLKAYVGNVAGFLLERQDILLLGWLGGLPAVGLYTVGVSFAELTWYIPNALSTAIAAKGGTTSEASGIDYVTRTTRVAVIIMAGTTVLGLLTIPLLIPLVYGGAFAGSVAVYFVLLPGILMDGVGRIVWSWQTMRGRQYWIQALAATLVNVVAVTMVAPAYGAVGTAAASTVTYAGLAVFTVWRFCRDTGVTASQVLVPTREDVSVVTRTLREFAQGLARRP